MNAGSITRKDVILGKRIRKYRRKAGLTQAELAEKIHVSTTHVGLVETGKRRMSLKTLQRIANVFQIKLRDILPY